MIWIIHGLFLLVNIIMLMGFSHAYKGYQSSKKDKTLLRYDSNPEEPWKNQMWDFAVGFVSMNVFWAIIYMIGRYR